jgi:predicted metal-dependent hydrolase
MNESDTVQHEFYYGGKTVSFVVNFRQSKQLTVRVAPDGQVRVIAPQGQPLGKVVARVQKRASWIIKQQQYFAQFLPPLPARQYVSGETHYYLGKRYRLKIIQASEQHVTLYGRYFYVYTSAPTHAGKVKKLLERWYRLHAEVVFRKTCAAWYERVQKWQIPYPTIFLRKMKKRWGSCSHSGNIRLNPDLVRAPLHCIEYVILHELCHLKEANHNRPFYRLLSRCLPDWQARKQRLEQVSWNLT